VSNRSRAGGEQAAFGSGRLAPSPTGKLHLGHARTFLIAYWHARSRGGRLVLRIEDLDVPRVVPGAADDIVRDLVWLGIDWDGPVVLQSSNLSASDAASDALLRNGLAYACVCTRSDLRTAQSAPQAGVAEPRYPGTCRGKFASVAEAERIAGKPAGVRFAVPPGRVDLVDSFAGPASFDVAAEVGDFLIARKGGLPAYQLAVVVDDASQGITEVVRGDDLLPSAARQCLLRRALGLPEPSSWHVPLVVDGAGRRLAKRADDLSLAELRDRGVDARAVVSWVARSAGIPDATHESAAELSSRFSMQRVSRTKVSSQGIVESFAAYR
jgi:glutamyl-tRNA synthetase